MESLEDSGKLGWRVYIFKTYVGGEEYHHDTDDEDMMFVMMLKISYHGAQVVRVGGHDGDLCLFVEGRYRDQRVRDGA